MEELERESAKQKPMNQRGEETYRESERERARDYAIQRIAFSQSRYIVVVK